MSRGDQCGDKDARLPVVRTSSATVVKVACLDGNSVLRSVLKRNQPRHNRSNETRPYVTPGQLLVELLDCKLILLTQRRSRCSVDLCKIQSHVGVQAPDWRAYDNSKPRVNVPRYPPRDYFFPPLTPTKTSFECVTRPFLCSFQERK